MKKYFANLRAGKNAKLNLLLILTLLFSVGLACKWSIEDQTESGDTKTERSDDDADRKDEKPREKADASTGEVPSEEALINLVSDTMNSFRTAVVDSDFSDFYNDLAEPWQEETSPKKLENGFRIFIENPGDIRQISGMTPEITGRPRIRRELGYKMLNVDGQYDTSPRKVKFELKYLPEGSDWKLSAIRVNTKD